MPSLSLNEKMKQTALTLFLLITTFTSHAETFKGTFSFTSTGITNGSVVPAPWITDDAYYIFDTSTQIIKIFNFLEEEIRDWFPIGNYRTFYVSRRNGNEPILTQNELIDFTVCSWTLHEQHEEEGCYGAPFESTITVDQWGQWNYSVGEWCFSIPPYAYGEITEFHPYEEKEAPSASIYLSEGAASISVYVTAPIGYKFTLYRSENLTDWDKVTSKKERNLGDGSYYGVGYQQSMLSDHFNQTSKAFYKTEVESLTIND